MKTSLKQALKATWSRVHDLTKVLMMLGVMVAVVGGLAWEEDMCGGERAIILAQFPLKIFEKMTVAEVENNNVVTVTQDGTETTLPFGFLNDQWEELKRLYKNGDCLFHYQIDCGVLCGSAGYVLFRNGEAVYFIQTMIS